jgi:two-component system cell cycle response regulator
MSGTGRLDASSGLFSQKMLETLLSHEVARSRRYPSPIALLYFALRFPKESSDQIVESAKLFFSNLLQSKIREADLPGHYEGNYLVIMPATDGEGAKTGAQRLLSAFNGSLVTRKAEPFEVSICIGISFHPGGEGISASRLLSDASTALWEAQRRGPKNLVLFDEIGPKA